MAIDAFAQSIIDGSKIALKMAETLVTTPMLINIDIKQGPKYAIPLLCETNQKSATAEVSESLVISSDAKKNITDNVAPGSKSWRLSGYIPGIRELEPINKYQPFVLLHTDILWSWFSHGAVLVFKDGNAQIYKQVVIKDLQTSQQKDSANATPFSLTLKEINTMETSLTDLPDDYFLSTGKAKKSMTTTGSALGNPSPLGNVTATIAQAASVGGI